MVVISIAGVIVLLVILGVLIFVGPVAYATLVSALKGDDPFNGFGEGLERVFESFFARLWTWLGLSVLIILFTLIWQMVEIQG
jgi:hypothetical protein